MELGNWGARMSEAQKKQMQNRLKDRLEKINLALLSLYSMLTSY